jgi:hypothetical protein
LEMLFGVLSVLRHSSAPAFSLIFIWSGQYTCVAQQNLADSRRPGTRDIFFLPLIRYRAVQQGSQETMWFEKKTGQQLTSSIYLVGYNFVMLYNTMLLQHLDYKH